MKDRDFKKMEDENEIFVDYNISNLQNLCSGTMDSLDALMISDRMLQD